MSLLRCFYAFCLFVCVAVCFADAQVPSGPGDWPQWRGPNRDGHSSDKGLLREWPKDGPRTIWQVDSVGVGYSSLAVKGGRIFTQGDLHGIEHTIALNAADGQILWAVQPEPVAQRLNERIESELKNLDKNNNGQVDEIEGLARIGWDFNKYDLPAGEATEELSSRRTAGLMAALDTDGDGRLSFAEAANMLRDRFERIDAVDKDANAAKLAVDRTAAYLKHFDKDADGRISRPEARSSLLDRNFNRIDQKITGTDKGDDGLAADEITDYLAKSEAGKDGAITAVELKNYYDSTKVSGDGVWTAAEMRSYYGGYRNGMGDGPRGTPTVDGDRVYVEGGAGDVTCLDAASGKTLWHVNLSRDFGGGVPGWGYSESPLIVGDLLVVTPGGKGGTLLALNKLSGKPVWQSREVTESAHYASPVFATIGGIPQLLQFARENVFGVTLAGGKLLWKYENANNGTANCCDPIVFQDHVFASSAYGTGGGLVKITTSGLSQTAEEVYFEKKMSCHHGGIVLIGQHMYSNAAGTLVCMDFLTGKVSWQARSVGKGALVAGDGMLFVLSEGHEVALVEATPDEYRERGRFKIQNRGRPSWAHPVVTGGRLYIRDQESLTAYDVARHN